MKFIFNNMPNTTTSIFLFFMNKIYYLNITVYSEHDIVSFYVYNFTININEL